MEIKIRSGKICIYIFYLPIMYQSPPPRRSDFSSEEEFQKHTQMYEAYIERTKKIQILEDADVSDEVFDKAMKGMGFRKEGDTYIRPMSLTTP